MHAIISHITLDDDARANVRACFPCTPYTIKEKGDKKLRLISRSPFYRSRICSPPVLADCQSRMCSFVLLFLDSPILD
jgi:hypothetical protein